MGDGEEEESVVRVKVAASSVTVFSYSVSFSINRVNTKDDLGREENNNKKKNAERSLKKKSMFNIKVFVEPVETTGKRRVNCVLGYFFFFAFESVRTGAITEDCVGVLDKLTAVLLGWGGL